MRLVLIVALALLLCACGNPSQEPPIKQHISVLIGDSITAMMPSIPDGYINKGIPGNTAAMESTLSWHESFEIDSSVIMLGFNDIHLGYSLDSYLASMTTIIKKCQASGSIVYVRSILPTNTPYEAENEQVPIWNAALKDLTLSLGAIYLDTHPLFCDPYGMLDQSLTLDGCHLSADGYSILLSAFFN